MSDDFETHPRGTAEELRLSRLLTSEMVVISSQYGADIFPVSVKNLLQDLLDYYAKQLEEEKYNNGI